MSIPSDLQYRISNDLREPPRDAISGGIGSELRSPKDTVLVGRDRPVTLSVPFRQYTDPEMPYMDHCHLLRHDDNGMMGRFVVERGTEEAVSQTMETHAH